MSLFETMGLFWTVGTSALATIALFYFAWCGLTTAWRQRERGATEEALDLRRQSEINYLEKRA